MSKNTLKLHLISRNGTAVTWTEVNPVLLEGEFGLEIDTKRGKYGDGVTPWNDLPYSDKPLRDMIEAEQQRISKVDKTLREHILNIRDAIKSGATLDEAKAALQALGDNYKDLFSLAGTLKSFLESTDTADTTINKWKEIEQFLSGISDTESLTALLEELEENITAAYTKAIEDKLGAQFEDDIFILDGGSPEGW